MDMQVTVSELSNLITTATNAGRPLMIHGSPGLGKSAAIHDAAAVFAGEDRHVCQLGDVQNPSKCFGLFDVRLSQCDPVDVGGLPYADKDQGTQRRLVPDWFPSTDRDDLPDFGFLVLEELPSAPPSVQAAAYQLTLDRRIGDKTMKPGWSILITGNLLTDGGVVHKIPTPLANRIIHVYVRSDVDSWCAWAIDHGIHEAVLAFIRFRPDLLNTFEDFVNDQKKGHAFATERTWEVVSDLMQADDNVPLALLSGSVGQGPATEFNQFRKVWRDMPSIDGILVDPQQAPIPDNRSTMYAVCTALAGRSSRDNFGNVLTYVQRLEPEFRALTVKDAMRRHGGEVTSTAAFSKWAVENKELLS